ncbi:MAG: YIP1 family protein [Syntrophomonadaceae bacterium]|nr:YIP1 family protein [Syntrophomonadaceae bacterium]
MELELNTDTLSLGQRLSRIFTNPSSVFMDLEHNSSWFATLLIIIGVSLAATLPLLSKIKEYGIITLQQIPNDPSLSNPETLAMVSLLIVITAIISAILIPVFFALIMALLLKLFNIFIEYKVPYRQLFAVSVYAYLPMLLSVLIGLGLGLMTPVESFGNVSTSLNLLFPPDSHSFTALLAAQINPFMLWSLYLTALGGSIMMKCNVRQVGTYLFVIWLLYALGTSYYSAATMSALG